MKAQVQQLEPVLTAAEIETARAAILSLQLPVEYERVKRPWTAPGIEGTAEAFAIIPDGYHTELKWRRTQP